jgi:hypothetical protein
LGAKWQKLRIGRSNALANSEQRDSPVQRAEGPSSLFPSEDG